MKETTTKLKTKILDNIQNFQPKTNPLENLKAFSSQKACTGKLWLNILSDKDKQLFLMDDMVIAVINFVDKELILFEESFSQSSYATRYYDSVERILKVFLGKFPEYNRLLSEIILNEKLNVTQTINGSYRFGINGFNLSKLILEKDFPLFVSNAIYKKAGVWREMPREAIFA